MAKESVRGLQRLARLADGCLALSTIGSGKGRLFRVWFWREGKDHQFTAESLEAAIRLALASVPKPDWPERCQARLRRAGAAARQSPQA